MIAVYITAALITVMAAAAFIQAKAYAKADSIYYREGSRAKLMKEYDRQLALFPVPYETKYVQTKYGKVYVVECGKRGGHTLVMFHAASVGAVSWKNNVEELGKVHRVVLIDTFGEGNKSELNDVKAYPKTSKEVADLYKDVTDQLGLRCATIVGATYGGFICLNYALHYPERVDKIILSGPMGVAKSVMKVILKLTFYSFYPYAIFSRSMAKWAFGNGPSLDDAAKYYNIVLEGVFGRYYAPKTLEEEVLQSIKAPVLLVLGKRDSLVGDVKKAAEYAANIPDLRVEVLDSGHLINAEKSVEFNRLLLEFE